MNVTQKADLTVDWINDKLYWTELHTIKEIDIHTLVVRDIASVTGTLMGIGVFPYKNNT